MLTNKKLKIVFAGFILAALLGSIYVFALRMPKIFSFRKENALDEWREKIFHGRVLYLVNLRGSDGYLAAHSEKAASGIFYRLSFNPRKEPKISWRWKVVQFPRKANGISSDKKGWIERDDYAARFYIIFPGFAFMGTRCLEYVWDKDLPEGEVLTSPYFKNIKIIVAESGDKNLGKWVYEERNVRYDYLRAFGREPGWVGAVAIMTDADNTLSTAEAWYDEIRVGYQNDEKDEK